MDAACRSPPRKPSTVSPGASGRTMKAIVRDRVRVRPRCSSSGTSRCPARVTARCCCASRAAGLDRGALARHGRHALPHEARGLSAFAHRRTAGSASDVAGVVEEIGPGVTGLQPGDAVLRDLRARHAEPRPSPSTPSSTTRPGLARAAVNLTFSRQPPFPSRPRRCRPSATRDTSASARACSSSEPRVASGRSPCRSPRHWGHT